MHHTLARAAAVGAAALALSAAPAIAHAAEGHGGGRTSPAPSLPSGDPHAGHDPDQHPAGGVAPVAPPGTESHSPSSAVETPSYDGNTATDPDTSVPDSLDADSAGQDSADHDSVGHQSGGHESGGSGGGDSGAHDSHDAPAAEVDRPRVAVLGGFGVLNAGLLAAGATLRKRGRRTGRGCRS